MVAEEELYTWSSLSSGSASVYCLLVPRERQQKIFMSRYRAGDYDTPARRFNNLKIQQGEDSTTSMVASDSSDSSSIMMCQGTMAILKKYFLASFSVTFYKICNKTARVWFVDEIGAAWVTRASERHAASPPASGHGPGRRNQRTFA